MAITVDNLQIEIQANANNASNSIKSLASALERLKNICKGGTGLGAVAKEVTALSKTSELKASKAVKNIAKSVRSGMKSVQAEIQNASIGGESLDGTANSLDGIKTSAENARMEVADLKDTFDMLNKGMITFADGNHMVREAINETASYSADIQDVFKSLSEGGINPTGYNALADLMKDAGQYSADVQNVMSALNSGTTMFADEMPLGDMSEYISEISDAQQVFDALSDGIIDFREEAGKTESALSRLSQLFKSTGESAKRSSSKFGQFLSSIKRIAMYRAIRGAMKAITSGFSEGVKNLTMYSASVEDTDSTMAHSTTSEYATQFLYLKNSIGSAVAPLIQFLLPTVKQVTQWFVNGANAVNQFFSALQGKSTYTKAKEYAQDTAEGLQEAVENAKELNKQLQGFDELNNLSMKEESSGAKKDNATDYSEMFEEVAIDSKIKDLAEQFDTILGTVGIIGAGILAWALSDTFLHGMEGLQKLVNGGIELVVGLALSFKAGYDLATDNTALGIIESISGAILSALGGSTIAKALGASTLKGSLAGLVLSVAITGVGLIFGAQAEYKKELEEAFDNSELGKTFAEVSEKYAETVETHLKLKAHVDEITGEIDAKTKADFAMAKKLIDEIFKLDAKDNKTSAELDLLKNKVETLNKLKLGNLQLSFDETGTHIAEAYDEVVKLYNKTLDEYKLEALREAYIDAYRSQYEEQQVLNELTEKYNILLGLESEAQKELADAQAELTEYTNAFTKSTKGATTNVGRNITQVLESQQAYKDLKKKVDTASVGFKKISDEVKESKNKMDDAKEVVGKYSKKVSELETRINEATGAIDEWNSKKMLDKEVALKIIADVTEKYKSSEFQSSKEKERDALAKSLSGSGYANGGYVPPSHLFYANEDGNAEYIGNMGGHTAVANSDQMSQAIESASYRGMARALAENGGSITLQVEGDPQGMFRVMQKQASNYSRRTGNQAFA